MIDFWIFPLSTIWGAYQNRCFKAFSFFPKAKVIKKVINHMFETSEEGGNLAQMRLIWYQKDLLC